MKSHDFYRGFSLVELLVVIAITVVTLSISIPVARSFLARSHSVNCAVNLRQIGLATMMYAGDNQMRLPVTSHQRSQGGKSWTLTLQPYASGIISFKCPQDPDKKRVYTYLINDFLTPNPAGAPHLDYSRLALLDQPAATLLFGEASASYRNTDHFHFSDYHGGKLPPEVFEHQVATQVHSGKANYLFADGHIETLSKGEVGLRLAALNSRFIDPSQSNKP